MPPHGAGLRRSLVRPRAPLSDISRFDAPHWSAGLQVPLEIPGVFLSTVIEGRLRKPVTNGDRRPWRTVAMLGFYAPEDVTLSRRLVTATGFLIRDRFLLTAAHAFDYVDRLAGPAVFFTAGGGAEPVGMVQLVDYREDAALDLAVGMLPGPQGLPLQVNGGPVQCNDVVQLAGYGYEGPGGEALMTTDDGKVQTSEDDHFTYLINTDIGDSGAPVMVLANNGSWSVAGVHLHGDIEGKKNGGVLLTSHVMQAVDHMIAELQNAHQ